MPNMNILSIPAKLIDGFDSLSMHVMKHPFRTIEMGAAALGAAYTAAWVWDTYLDEPLHEFKEELHAKFAAKKDIFNHGAQLLMTTQTEGIQ